MFVNYAHRGASEYAPENTFSAFYLGLLQGANGIETDIRKTKDGILVLFHDSTMDRVTDGEGSFYDYTYAELLKLTVFNNKPAGVKIKEDKIISLADFLKYFYFRDIHFAIELKEQGIGREVLNLIYQFNLAHKTIITSFDYDNLAQIRKVDKTIKTGYLVREVNNETVGKMKAIAINQVCPHANTIDKRNVEYLKGLGFTVRAWGVRDTDTMKRVFAGGADGMTVNFPDKLSKLLKEEEQSIRR